LEHPQPRELHDGQQYNRYAVYDGARGYASRSASMPSPAMSQLNSNIPANIKVAVALPQPQ
jgi:hypothetical protein